MPKTSPFFRAPCLPHSVAVVAVLLCGLVEADAASPTGDVMAGLASHRAVYEMRLDRAEDRAGVVGVDGRLVYEFGGSVCEGFSSRFRLVTRLAVKDGPSRLTDLRTTSFEDAEGRGFDFLNQNFVDDRMVEEVTGNVERSAEKLKVKIVRPSARAIELPAVALFPTRHMASIIAAAEAGQQIDEIELYDGSETGDRIFRTSVVIGAEAIDAAADPDEPAATSELLAGHRRWPISIAYFKVADETRADAMPDYQMSFLLYDNGITRRMRLDYGDFALAGRLTSLEAVPARSCGR